MKVHRHGEYRSFFDFAPYLVFAKIFQRHIAAETKTDEVDVFVSPPARMIYYAFEVVGCSAVIEAQLFV